MYTARIRALVTRMIILYDDDGEVDFLSQRIVLSAAPIYRHRRRSTRVYLSDFRVRFPPRSRATPAALFRRLSRAVRTRRDLKGDAFRPVQIARIVGRDK